MPISQCSPNSRWRQCVAEPGAEGSGLCCPVDGAVSDLEQVMTFYIVHKNPGRTDPIFDVGYFICLSDVESKYNPF